MIEDTPRCPRCGKHLPADANVCPACGFEFLPHRSRIRCNRCGQRISSDSAVCPRCGSDPRSSRSLSLPKGAAARSGAIVVGAFVVICIGWIIFRALTTNTLPRALGLLEPTRTPTQQVVQVIYVVATPVPATPTLVPTATFTPTSRFSPTPTRRGAHTPTPTPAAPTPTLAAYSAPQLIAPANATIFTGAEATIALEWQPISMGSLRENEWYRISVSYTGRDGKPTEQTGWSKETRWSVPTAWWNAASPDARMFKWNVTVMRVEGIDPFASPSRTPASPTSATRSFIWN